MSLTPETPHPTPAEPASEQDAQPRKHWLLFLCFAREAPDPRDSAKKFSTTWFDMFRIEGGKIAEHWDPAQKL